MLRSYASPRAAVTLCLDSKQMPLLETRIRLDAEFDHLGMLKTVVDWTVSDHDLSTLRSFASYLRERFDALGLEGVNWRPEIFDPEAEISGITDTYRPMGGCRMGIDPRQNVVDPNLTVHRIQISRSQPLQSTRPAEAPTPASPPCRSQCAWQTA